MKEFFCTSELSKDIRNFFRFDCDKKEFLKIFKFWRSYFDTERPITLKETPRFITGGDKNGGIFLTSKCKILGLECRRKFKLVLAQIMDPSGPFGARSPPKIMCTHEAHALEKKWSKKMAILRSKWRRMCLVSANHVGAPAPLECVKQGLEPKRMVYTPS